MRILFEDAEKNIQSLFPLVCIDIETTGLCPEKDEIVEVSAVKYNSDFAVSKIFSVYCKPLHGVQESAMRVNGLTEEFLGRFQPFGNSRAEFQAFVDGCNIIGYGVEFDIKFLRENGIVFDGDTHYYDVLRLARKKLRRAPKDDSNKQYQWDVENHKLTTVCDYFGIASDNAHDSLADCKMTMKAFEKLLQA